MTGWPAKSLWDGARVQTPFRATCSRPKVVNAKRRVAKAAPVIVLAEYVHIILKIFGIAGCILPQRKGICLASAASIGDFIHWRRLPLFDKAPPVTTAGHVTAYRCRADTQSIRTLL